MDIVLKLSSLYLVEMVLCLVLTTKVILGAGWWFGFLFDGKHYKKKEQKNSVRNASVDSRVLFYGKDVKQTQPGPDD